jgi:4,5-dihydroxyphthalate decarboxylase
MAIQPCAKSTGISCRSLKNKKLIFKTLRKMKKINFLFFTLVVLVTIVSCNSSPKDDSNGTVETNKNLSFKLAGYDYDRIRAISDGKISIEGADVSFTFENIYELNKLAFGPEKRYDVTELGLIPYITKYINNDFRDYTLIPIFLSRTFRHRNIFVHANSGIEKPEDLKGKRVGTPGYGMSANTWIRGFLLDEYGVEADDFQWIETTESSDGAALNTGFSKYYFGDDFPLTKGPEGIDESELLLNGDCDALITAITPRSYLEGNPNIKQLFSDVRAVESNYYRKTKLFPIMHVVAIRKDVLKEHPWLAKAIFDMYSKAKKVAYKNLESTTVLRVTLPWALDEYESTKKLMGENYWKYGIESNRKVLEILMRYVYEQGLVKRQIKLEELFDPSTLELNEY